LSSSERVYKTVHHIQPDRTPVFLGRIDDLEYWERYFNVKGEEELRTYFGLDLRKVKYNGLFDLFGMANTMLNMHEAPELIEAAITHVEYFVLGSMKKAMEYCAEKVEFFWCGDDFSTQRGLMISPDMWRRFLGPSYRKIFSLIKSFGLKVWFHSCGPDHSIQKNMPAENLFVLYDEARK
jgi:hypothetical protein